jgi:poly-gamma-glutamate system protein
MAEATGVLKKCREARGLPIDGSIDINRTGLIGLEFSPITTSVGQLAAKRTTTNPNMAALAVCLMRRAGVRRGETVAVGASGSFPALILAVLAACKTLDVHPLFIPSLGASQWGANNPAFHWLIMQECLRENGMWDFPPVAVSMGGERDVGGNMQPDGRALLRKAIAESGLEDLSEPVLAENVRGRMNRIKEAALGKRIRAFINIGGSYSNIGTDEEILNLRPGIVRVKWIPPQEKRGLLFAMARRHIPVIHLLFIKGLVRTNNLPWDPAPLPRPGEGDLYRSVRERDPVFLFLAGMYLAVMAGIIWAVRRSFRESKARPPE